MPKLSPVFYAALIFLFLIIFFILMVAEPSIKKISNTTPYYDEAVLVFPTESTEWRLSPESINDWPQYLCLIKNKWHKCYPQFIDPTPVIERK